MFFFDRHSLGRFPYFKVRDSLEIRIVSRDIREMVTPHYSERDCIVREKTVFIFDFVALVDVFNFDRKNLDTE